MSRRKLSTQLVRLLIVGMVVAISPMANIGQVSAAGLDSPLADLYFTDVYPSDAYYTGVEYMANHGVISGYGDGTFRPADGATRAQISKIIMLAKGWSVNTSGGPHFQDVPPTDWAYSYIETVYNHGIISGYTCGAAPAGSCVPPSNLPFFLPGNATYRGQYLKMVVNAQAWPINNGGAPHFTDTAGTTFSNYIETGYNHLAVTGYVDGTFRPYNYITRGELCQILYIALALARPDLHYGPYPGSNNRNFPSGQDLTPRGSIVSYYTDYGSYRNYRVLGEEISWDSAASGWIYQYAYYGNVGIVFHAFGQGNGQPCSLGQYSQYGANLPGFDPNYTVEIKPACLFGPLNEIRLFMAYGSSPNDYTAKYQAYAVWNNQEAAGSSYQGKFNIDNYWRNVNGDVVYRDFMQNICYQGSSIYNCP